MCVFLSAYDTSGLYKTNNNNVQRAAFYMDIAFKKPLFCFNHFNEIKTHLHLHMQSKSLCPSQSAICKKSGHENKDLLMSLLAELFYTKRI